jgi:hypothetical protein
MSKHKSNHNYFSQFFNDHEKESAVSNMILLFLGLVICIFAINAYNSKKVISPSVALYNNYMSAAEKVPDNTDLLVIKSNYESNIAQNPKNPWLYEKYSNFLLKIGYFGDAHDSAITAKKLATGYMNTYGENAELATLITSIDKTITLSEKYMRGE